jgi:transcription antitermination factor NusG
MLRQSDIDIIREIERGLTTPKPGKSLHSFKTGDRVRFKDAAWPPGVVSSSTGDGRLAVEVELMGRIVPIHVFPHQIEKA